MKERPTILPYPMECYYDLVREALMENAGSTQLLLHHIAYNLSQETAYLAQHAIGGEELLDDISEKSALLRQVKKLSSVIKSNYYDITRY